jgi:cytochrome c-type biogenesis protein CcmH/NrfG
MYQFQAGRYKEAAAAYRSASSIDPENTTYKQGVAAAEDMLPQNSAASSSN